MTLLEDLRADFPTDYWAPFYREFGHNFFDMHAPRTLEYDRILGDRLKEKAVLEVGGYPGLMAAWLLRIGCRLTTIESPDYFPGWYQAWLQEKKVTSIVHNIIKGPPLFTSFWNWITLSDVLIHMNGLPMGFLAWASACSERILLSHWKGSAQEFKRATDGTLKKTWEMPSSAAIMGAMATVGMKPEEEIESGDRVILIYRKVLR